MRVAIVQQGVRRMQLETMPLAAGYLKASLDSHPETGAFTETRILNFDGRSTAFEMLADIIPDGDVPDVLALSVQGWSYRRLCSLSSAYKQLNPHGRVIMGGTHVANQGARVFTACPDVDVVVNCEGELVLPAVLSAYETRTPLSEVHGVSFLQAGSLITTDDPGRILNLDEIPSPFLSGTLQYRWPDGAQRYDVALMETNRGCPYKCAFCFWGGAVGQKIRRFSRERLRAELDLFGRAKVESLVLCDANFGMQEGDLQFVQDLIEVRGKYGYPRTLETSWAKNKTSLFYSIVDLLATSGLQSAFTLSLQTTEPEALGSMKRRNMRVNEWGDLTERLNELGLRCYAELIWGAPGETVQTFLRGYDDLSERVTRVAVYPLMILPNTDYSDSRDVHGLKTVRGEHDDYEYVLSHRTMSLEDNLYMQRLLLWIRAVGESFYWEDFWRPLRKYAGLTRSDILIRLMDWFDRTSAAELAPLRTTGKMITDAERVAGAIRCLYNMPYFAWRMLEWWDAKVAPSIPDPAREILRSVFEWECARRPRFALGETAVDAHQLFHTVAGPSMEFDIRSELTAFRDTGAFPMNRQHEWTDALYFRAGFADHVDSHEVAHRYIGLYRDELPPDFKLVADGLVKDASSAEVLVT